MPKQIVNYQKKWRQIEVNVTSLVLDVENIRIDDKLNTELEVINDLFMNEDAFVILKSIVQNGYFPDEPPVVIKQGKKIIVIDGNRRVASLKAMISPSIAPGNFSSKILELMRNKLPINTIDVHVAPSRESAMEYLAAKHTKTTRKPWSPLRRAYFYYAQKENGHSVQSLIEKYKSVDIPRYISMFEMHLVSTSLKNLRTETLKQVLKKRDFPISTLERFYADSEVQSTLGLKIDGETGEVSKPTSNDFDKVMSKVVTDIVEGVVNSRKELQKDVNRRIYLKKVIDQECPDGYSTGSVKEAAAVKPRRVVAQQNKTALVPKSIEDVFEEPGIGRILHELQSLNYEKFPNATADLLRTFLECVLKKHLDLIKESPVPRRSGGYVFLDDVLTKMESLEKGKGNHRIMQVIQAVKQSKWYLDSLNHNPDVFATKDKVKDAWDLMHPLVKWVFDKHR